MPTEIAANSLDHATHMRNGRRIEYISVAWTSLEALAGITAGIIAGSLALMGFGADSLIEVASSVILLWRLSDHELGEQRERTALKLVGISFLLLAGYVAYESIESLVTHQPPHVSYFGICFSGVCLIVMPILARAKRRIALHLHSAALEADSRQSSICAYLAAILLGGLWLYVRPARKPKPAF